jgi:hypothetical protein
VIDVMTAVVTDTTQPIQSLVKDLLLALATAIVQPDFTTNRDDIVSKWYRSSVGDDYGNCYFVLYTVATDHTF